MSDPTATTGGEVRLAVCQTTPSLRVHSPEWNDFCAAVQDADPDILLLSEMPFGDWLASLPERDMTALTRSIDDHSHALAAIGELSVPIILGSRPLLHGGRPVNEAFIWTPAHGCRGVHTKQFFPQESGYYERSWFERGESHFRTVTEGELNAGFLICTELMFNEWARRYGRLGANLIAVPRVTPAPSTRRWLVALRMAAIVSGAYAASSNRCGTAPDGHEFGAHGWIVDPYGDVIAETSSSNPVAVATVQLDRTVQAQREYPCYVEELP